MRCMGCGAEMVLTAIVPAETMAVRGFEHQAFRCLDCGETEERLTFTSDTARRAELISTVPVMPPPQPDQTIPEIRDAPAVAWIRSVEKLRTFEAEIHRRPTKPKKTDWNVQFDQACEPPTSPPREAVQSRSRYARSGDRNEMFAHTARGRLRKTAGEPLRRNEEPGPIERNIEEVLQFNQFWESLREGAPLKLPSGLPLSGSAELLPRRRVASRE
jgi:hypothetical protein